MPDQEMPDQDSPDRDEQRLHERLDTLQQRLPDALAGLIGWLRQPKARVVRIPAGVLLMCGGVLGFLPVLGFWMLPLGFAILALDVPFLRRPTVRALAWIERRLPS